MITWKGQLGTLLDSMVDHENMIIHTGAFCGRQKSIDDPSRFVRNINDTFKYLELARSERKKFVFTSTWDTDINPYTESKRACQNMVYLWNKIYSVDYLVFVLPSIIGRGVVECFLRAQEPTEIDNRILYFSSLESVAEQIASQIDSVNVTIEIPGEPICVTLLLDLMKYARKSVLSSDKTRNVQGAS